MSGPRWWRWKMYSKTWCLYELSRREREEDTRRSKGPPPGSFAYVMILKLKKIEAPSWEGVEETDRPLLFQLPAAWVFQRYSHWVLFFLLTSVGGFGSRDFPFLSQPQCEKNTFSPISNFKKKRPAATPQLQRGGRCGIPAPPILQIAIKNRNFRYLVYWKLAVSPFLSVQPLAPDIHLGKRLMDVDGLLV